VNVSDLRPVYRILESPRHLVEVISVLVVIGLLFDGYAILLAALAINRWIQQKLRNERRLMQAASLLQDHSPIQSTSSAPAKK
jgi:hypothetical protein